MDTIHGRMKSAEAELEAGYEFVKAQLAELESLREKMAEFQKEAKWIRNKLKLPEDTKLLSGSVTLAGTMHIVVSNANGYLKYIETERCDDKAGEIARLSVEIDKITEEKNQMWFALNTAELRNDMLDKALIEIIKEANNLDVLPIAMIAHKVREAVTHNMVKAVIDSDKRFVDFYKLPLGAKFKYPKSDRIYIKIEHNKVAVPSELYDDKTQEVYMAFADDGFDYSVEWLK